MASKHVKICSTYVIAAAAAKLLQSSPTLCNPIDGNPPGFWIHGIFQARVHISLGNCKLKQQKETTTCPFRMAKIHNTDSNKHWWGHWNNRNSHSLPMGMKNGTASLEDNLEVFFFLYINLNIFLPYNPVIILLSVYPNESRTVST